MARGKLLWIALLFVSCLWPVIGDQAQIFHFTDLGDLPGGANVSAAFAINDFGQVTGESSYNKTGRTSGQLNSFLWTPTVANGTTGSMQPTGILSGGRYSIGWSINDYGQVAGEADYNPGYVNSVIQSFLWTPTTANSTTGSLIDIDAGEDFTQSEGYGINSRGQVAGRDTNGFATLWSPNDTNSSELTSVQIGALSGDLGSVAYAINSFGQIVGASGSNNGDHGFLWTPTQPNSTNGTMVDVGFLAGGENETVAEGENSSGEVVGSSGGHAFLWTPLSPNGISGSMTDLQTLPGGTASGASAINLQGEVVGASDSTSGSRAFLWNPTQGMLDLNSLVDSSVTGWTLTDAGGINDLGQIVGTATNGTVSHGFLLTPLSIIPEPTMLTVLMMAIWVPMADRHRSLQGDMKGRDIMGSS